MNDLQYTIAKLFLVFETWQKYHKYLDYEFIRHNFPDVFKLFQVINSLQQENKDGKELSLVDLEAGFGINYPRLDQGVLLGLVQAVSRSDTTGQTVERFLGALRERAQSTEIAFLALDVADGKKDVQELRKLTKAFSSELSEKTCISDTEFITDDLEALYDEAFASGGLKWRLSSLNKSLGPLRKGDFGFIFARPESGKTTFVADQATFMAEQCQGPVLWINNEEQGEKVKLRLFEATLGANLEQIAGNKERASAAYLERTGGRIKLKDDATISKSRVEEICRSLKPELIIIDQLDKIRGFDADRDDLKLGSIYQWARELAKEFAPVIGVCQANGTAEGIKFLNMGHVANALTSKQAEADFILGIGVDYADPSRIRGFSICKNKLLGGPESIPALRHAKFEVLLNAEICRYVDVT